jgi:hypothetical protein
MTAPEQVQVTQADRDAVKDFFDVIFDKGAPTLTLIEAHEQAFAHHRHTATADALEAMREALPNAFCSAMNQHAATLGQPPLSDDETAVLNALLTTAIAMIEGDTK